MASQVPATPAQAGLVSPSQLSFETVMQFANFMRTKSKDRQKWVRKFMEQNIDRGSHDAFAVFRLLLPKFDNVRHPYNLLENKIASTLIKACGVENNSAEAKAARNWRRVGGKSAGDFAGVMKDNLLNIYCSIAPNAPPEERRKLKVGFLNQKLDELAEAAGDSKRQANIFRELLQKTTPEQMAFILQIMLKNLKINVGEGSIFPAWHKDALVYFNNGGMDLRFIFNEMVDENQRFDTSCRPGNAMRPQLARAVYSASAALHVMHTEEKDEETGEEKVTLEPFVVETKFDGERMQVHRLPMDEDGKEAVQWYSRKAIEHGEQSGYNLADEMILKHTRGPCILDGELIVWNKKRSRFEPFGSVKPLISAIRECKPAGDKLDRSQFNQAHLNAAMVVDSDYELPLIGDCELFYVVFDVLHDGRASLIKEPLKRRLEVLESVVLPGCDTTTKPPVPFSGSCVGGRVVALVPEKTRFGELLGSRYGSSEKDIKDALDEVNRLKEEGIVLKRPNSLWESNDRSYSWAKFKPGYVRGVDLDCLVIGAWGGSGQRRGGAFSQFLLALKDSAAPGCWVSFCKVGSGMDQDDLDRLNAKLQPVLQFADNQPPPACYKLTGREKPEVWVSKPEESVVLRVDAELRTIPSQEFATGCSLRFPTVNCIRDDKLVDDANSTQELQNILDTHAEKAKGESLFAEDGEPGSGTRGTKRKRNGRDGRGPKRPKVPQARVVVAKQRGTDLSKVEKESDILEGCNICFLNTDGFQKGELEALVKRLGGQLWARPGTSVTHVLAAVEDKKTQAFLRDAKFADCNIIRIAWLEQCAAEKRRVPLSPRHYLKMTHATMLASPGLDGMGDSYFSDVEEGDVGPLLGRTPRPGGHAAEEVAARLAEDSGEEDAWDEGMDGVRHQLRRQRPGSEGAAAALGAYLDAQLRRVGALDPRFALLRGCTAVLLKLGTGQAGSAPGSASASASEARLAPSVASLVQRGRASLARLQQLQAATAAAELRLMGGSVTSEMGPAVTHLVGIALTLPAAQGPGGQAPALQPEALLRAVVEQAGGGEAVSTLRLWLGTGDTHLVADSWVHRCREEAESWCLGDPVSRGTCRPPPEAGDSLGVGATDLASLEHWPWTAFPGPGSGSHRSLRPYSSGGEGQASPASRRRGSAIAAAQHRPAPARSRATAGASVKQEADVEQAQGRSVAPSRRRGRAVKAESKQEPGVKMKEEMQDTAAHVGEEQQAAGAPLNEEPRQQQQQQLPAVAAAALAPAPAFAPAAPPPAAPQGASMYEALFGALPAAVAEPAQPAAPAAHMFALPAAEALEAAAAPPPPVAAVPPPAAAPGVKMSLRERMRLLKEQQQQ